MSNSLWLFPTPQHARPPCPSPTHRVHPNPCPVSGWCHPAISSSVVPFSSHPQSFPASESFQMSQLFAWGGQSIGVSASTSVLPMNTQDWSPLGWNSFAFLMIHRMLAIWSLVPLPFLKPAWTSGSSQFTYCWSLAWRILSITLLVCEKSAIVQ